MTKLKDAILQNLQVWWANRKKQYSVNMKIIILQKSKKKRFIVNDFLSRFSLTHVNVTEKMSFLICMCV